jgi:hypothetical protein
MAYLKAKKRQILGASLVELSVVLVIAAGLIAGAMHARSIIANAEMNILISEMAKVKQAHNTFEKQYGYLPGDFPNGSSMFGVECTSALGGCNGNGDGGIDSGRNRYLELRNSMWHLVFAGLYDAKRNNQNDYSNGPTLNYGGLFTPGLLHKNISFDAVGPALSFSYLAYSTSDVSYLRVSDSGQKYTGAAVAFFTNIPKPVLTVGEAYYIDNKLDDGAPFTGKVLSTGLPLLPTGTGCVTGTYVYTNADYYAPNYLVDTNTKYIFGNTSSNSKCILYYAVN